MGGLCVEPGNDDEDLRRNIDSARLELDDHPDSVLVPSVEQNHSKPIPNHVHLDL